MCSVPIGGFPIVPSPEPTPKIEASLSPSAPVTTPKKSNVEIINDRITGLLAERREHLGKVAAGVDEFHKLEIAKAPKAEKDIVKKRLVEANAKLISADAAIEGEFKRLDELFTDLVRKHQGPPDEKERKAEGDFLPSGVKAAFAIEQSLREHLEEEIIRSRLDKHGQLEGLSPAEASSLVKKTLKEAKMLPEKFEKLFKSTLKKVAKNAIPEKQLQRLGEIYLKSALPLQQRAKKALGVLNPVAKIAANVGKAAVAGFAAAVTNPKVTGLGVSQNQVFLAGGAVFKKSNKRAEAEERLYADVAALLSGSAVPGSFAMASATPSRVGASMMTSLERYRAISYEQFRLNPRLEGPFFKKLPPDNAAELRTYLAALPEGKPESEVHFVPILEGDKKAAYEKCEKHKYIYASPSGKKMISFRQMQQLILEKGLMVSSELTPIPKGDSTSIPTRKELLDALTVPWKAILPSVVVSDVDAKGKAERSLGVLTGFDSKVRVMDMKTVDELMRVPKMLNGILQRLSPHAEQQMMLTLTMQNVDLHAGNIGLKPVSTPEYEAMKDLPKFKEYQEQYLSGELTESSPLFKENPALLKVLQGEWEIVLFDTDLSLEESNLLEQMRVTRNEYGPFPAPKLVHFIPLRSAFLEVPGLRDKALTPEALELVKNENLHMSQLAAWIKGEDRPIQRQLNRLPDFKKSVYEYVQPLIDAQSFRVSRQIVSDSITLEELALAFAKKLTNITDPNNKSFWWEFEVKMNFKSTNAGENLGEFALRNNLDLEKLLFLNPALEKDEAIPAGRKVRIEDLTSRTSEAQEKRMKIALQLFPRMTSGQKTALFQRKEAQSEYLAAHEGLKAFFADPSRLDVAENREMLKKYVESRYTPIASIDKDALLKEIAAAPDLAALKIIGMQLIETTKPTFLRIAGAIYPFLTDAYALSKEIYGDAGAGKSIGFYLRSLEDQIEYARKENISVRAIALANKIEASIADAISPASIAKPSFFLNVI